MHTRNEVSAVSANHSPLAIPEVIASIDLEATKYKLIKEEGWSLGRVDAVETLYKGFLALVSLFPEETHVPTEDIDEMWHTHILDTRKYMSDCQSMFGTYLHHYPYLGVMGADDATRAAAMFDATRARFEDLGIDVTSIRYAGCGGGGGGGGCGAASCASPGGDSGGYVPATPPTPTPTPATCGAPGGGVADDKKRQEEDKPSQRRTPSGVPALRLWERSVDPAQFPTEQRPGRDAVLEMAMDKQIHTDLTLN